MTKLWNKLTINFLLGNQFRPVLILSELNSFQNDSPQFFKIFHILPHVFLDYHYFASCFHSLWNSSPTSTSCLLPCHLLTILRIPIHTPWFFPSPAPPPLKRTTPLSPRPLPCGATTQFMPHAEPIVVPMPASMKCVYHRHSCKATHIFLSLPNNFLAMYDPILLPILKLSFENVLLDLISEFCFCLSLKACNFLQIPNHCVHALQVVRDKKIKSVNLLDCLVV